MSDKKKVIFSDKLSEIEDSLHEAGELKNLKEILKSHKNIKNKINNTSEKLKQIKQQFEAVKSDTQAEKINDEMFEKYMDDINKEGKSDQDNDLENLVLKYKNMIEKLKSCEKYLKDKKMEITYCKDDTDADTESESQSINSSD